MLFNSRKSQVSSTAATTTSAATPMAVAKPKVQRPSLSSTGDGSGLVTIGAGTRITGVIDECSTLDVHGILEGDAVADLVIIRDGGGIRGNIQARNAEIYGTVDGTINVAEHLEIKSTGNVSGEMSYVTIAVEKDAQFTGAVQCVQNIHSDPIAADMDDKSLTYATDGDPKIIDTYVVSPADSTSAKH
jgi:cytoskeletal protein CcmA (bactofilin family)